ncbi:MAG: hypothetical protein ACD_5C00317G0005 [uncultured bacterium]|nr:MAG: hypothetical protein ACD_5C00317G0005 [uncultured bacterium]
MNKSSKRELCLLSIIFKHPKTGLYMSVVECGTRNCFENSIKALEAKKIEIIFKHCESESELFELGLSLHEAFTGADFLLSVSAAKINTELTKKTSTKAEEKIATLPKRRSYSFRPNNLSSITAASL